MTMTGGQHTAARVLAAAAVLNAVLNASLIPILGVNGAATATALSIVTWNALLVAVVWKRLQLWTLVIAKPSS